MLGGKKWQYRYYYEYGENAIIMAVVVMQFM